MIKKKKNKCPSCALPKSTCGRCGKERIFLDAVKIPYSQRVANACQATQILFGQGAAKDVDTVNRVNEEFYRSDAVDDLKHITDSVRHPKHYNTGKIEVIEFLEDQRLGLHLGNVVKYVCRAGRKDKATRIEDLEKGAWYLQRKIELLKAKRDRRAAKRPNEMTAELREPANGKYAIWTITQKGNKQ